MQQSVSVEKPDEYRLAPQFQPSVVQSAVNRYKMVIQPLSFTEQRASYSWRAPGVGTVMSPNLFIEADFDIDIPGVYDYATAVGPIIGRQRTISLQNTAPNETFNVGPRPKMVFGAQDAFGGAIDNIQVTVNGASISNARLNTYKTSLDRCWLSDKLFDRRFGQCGGAPQAYDSKAVSGECYFRSMTAVDPNVGGDNTGAVGRVTQAGFHQTSVRMYNGNNPNAQGYAAVAVYLRSQDLPFCSTAANTPAVVAFTADSGLQKRTESMLGCVSAFRPSLLTGDKKTVTIRWPVNGEGGIFSPVCPTDKLSACCPYRNSAMALPHFNSVSIDILFTDLVQCLFRNLSTRLPGAGSADSYVRGNRTGGIRVRLRGSGDGEQKPRLLVEYLRLASYQQLPASANLQVFRCSVHNPTSKVAGAGQAVVVAATMRSGIPTVALPCVGVDRHTVERSAQLAADRTYTCEWDGIVSAQPPKYILFTMQKSSSVYAGVGTDLLNKDAIAAHINTWNYSDGDTAAMDQQSGIKAGLEQYYLSRNTDCSASIKTFELEIQSSIGAYVVAGDSEPFLRTRADLYRDHLRYMPEDYMSQQDWYKHNCCMMVGVDQYARGLCTSGEAFPITLRAKIKFESARQFITGEGACGVSACGEAVQQDPLLIVSQPVMVQIFPNSSLQVSPSAALLSSQNLSHSQAMEILARS